VPWGPFREQQTYNRYRDIHGVYGGQQQGGICTPAEHPVVIVFTGASGEQQSVQAAIVKSTTAAMVARRTRLWLS
jgi:hypothetical protein